MGTEPGTRRRSPAFSLVLLALAVLIGYTGWAGLEQGLQAARGEGTPGVFTVAELTCVQHPGHESCTCHGEFAPEDAAADGGEPRAVYLHAAGRDACAHGAQIDAVDAGAANRVYGPDGSREWVLSVLLLAAAAGGAGGVTFRLVLGAKKNAR